MIAGQNYLWRKAPFIRITTAFIIGILLQWYLQLFIKELLIAASVVALAIVCVPFFSLQNKFRFRLFIGLAFTSLIIIAGALLTWLQDVRHDANWFGKNTHKTPYVLVTLQEPLVEKPASYKALVRIDGISNDGEIKNATGTAIIYFKKDTLVKNIGYGSQLLLAKPLEEVKNEGNPGGFDYKRYCLFQGITHQTNIGAGDYVVLPLKDKHIFYTFLFNSRVFIINIIRQYIINPKEQGLAEALLIGYKNDLDKDLVQSYTNTGVVHIIAISGLHLGLIYWLLLILTKPLSRKKLAWVRLVIILCGLWLFSLLAGGQPSILRSAVMFSVIAIANVLDKRSSIYNTLSLSAFILLCINPFWLWDVGFQLSYAAVLSIIIFFKPVYHWWQPDNKLLDLLWKMMAVTLSAQILTLPVSLYHFHQFPVLFLFTNILAIPLSSLILMGEILLCALFILPPVATLVGQLIEWLLRVMNNYIEGMNSVSFAVIDGISISLLQTILLTAVIISIAVWLLDKVRISLWIAVACFTVFVVLHSWKLIEIKDQKKLIVYNVPRYQAIDLIDGMDYTFIGDEALEQNALLRNFHIQPTRTLYGVQKAEDATTSHFVTFYNKKILVLDTTLRFSNALSREAIDVLILSHNPKIYINDLVKRFETKQVVIDGSVPFWKAKLWQKDCALLHLPCYNVSEKGAFVMSLP